MTHIPKVSIGMPVYNGEKIVRVALDSLLAQTFTDFELIISDNASTDRTGEICQEYAKKDPRIHYVRQPKTQEAESNFQFVLDKARGEYFMLACDDDVRSPDYLSVNIDFLSKNPDFVASTSPVRFEGGKFNEIKMGDFSLVGDKAQRIVHFFKGGFNCGRFYSLMRRDMVKDYPIADRFLGNDLALVLHLASKGNLNRASEGSVVLGKSGNSNTNNIFRTFRKSLIYFFFPFYRLSVYTLKLSKDFSTKDKIKIIWALIIKNLKGFIMQFLVELRRG